MTASRAASYVQDSVFESGYIAQQRPALLSYVAASTGFKAPNPGAPFTYLELGCSIGVTLNGLAASNPHATFYGIDFNAEHIRLAKAAADDTGLSNVHFVQANFTQFETLDLPQFDYVAIHGSYSWLDPDAEEAVHAIVQSHLKDSGLFYVDYMAMPGKAPVAPMWTLMRKLTERSTSSSEERARSGLAMLQVLEKNKAQYFTKVPDAKNLLDYWVQFLKDDPNGASQLAHNALAPAWSPRFFEDATRTFGQFGLTYAGSTDLVQNDLQLSLPQVLRPEGAGDADRYEAESVKDFYHYTQQRQDVFVKTAEEPSDPETFLASEICVGFFLSTGTPTWTFREAGGFPLKLNDGLISEIQTHLSDGAKSIRDLAGHLRSSGYGDQEIATTLKRVLTVQEANIFAVAPEAKEISETAELKAANKYNELAIAELIKGGGLLYLAAPKIGGCIVLPSLVSAIIATLVGNGSAHMPIEDLAQQVRAIPGNHRNEHGYDIEAGKLPEKMVASAYAMVMQAALPGLVAVEALVAEA